MALGNTLGLGIVLSAQDLASGPLARVDRAFTSLDDHVGRGAIRMQASFGGLGGRVMAFASGALASLGILKTIDIAGDFEAELAKVQAVSDATAAQLAQLRDAAINAGVATQFSPIEATRGLNELAQAGYDVDQSIQLLIPTLDLAAASFGELSPEAAAGLAAQSLKAFGIDAKDASFAVDQMLQAVNMFSLKTSDLPLSIGVASRGAQALHQSFSETLISLGLVKNVLPSIERSSTAVATAMERLANPEVQARLAGVGVAVTDARGRFRGFLDVLADLAPQLDKMTERRRASFLISVFGNDALGGAQAVLTQIGHGIRTTNGEIVKGAAAVAYLRSQFDQAGGTAARFREIMLDTFAGQKRQLLGSLQTLAIMLGGAFAEVLTPVLRALTGFINLLIRALRAVPDPVRRVIATVIIAAAGLIAFGTAVLLLQRGLALLRVALLAARVAVGEFVVALGPIALVLLAVAAVVAGFVVAYRHNLGGIADLTHRVVRDVALAYRALAQLFSDGAFSGAVRDEIDRAENRGLKRFVITLYMLGYRLERLWEGIKEGFVAAIEVARPSFEALAAAFRELGDEIAGLVGDITGSASKLPSQQFLSFGQIVGTVLGTIVGWLVTAFGWIVRFTSGLIAGFRAMEEYIGPAFELLGAALADLRDAFEELFGIESYGSDQAVTLGDVFRTLGEIVGRILGGAVAALTIALTILVKTLEYIIDVATWVKDAFVKVASAISDAGSAIEGVFGGVLNVVGSVFAGVAGFFGGLYNLIKKVVELITDAINALVDALKKAAGLVTGFFSDIWGGLKDIGGAIGDAGSYVGSKVGDAASAAGGFVADTASSIFSGPSLGDLMDQVRSEESTPSAADVEAQATFMRTLASLQPGGAALTKQPTTVNVQLQVDGEVLARATAKANEDAARRAFVPVPVGAF